jgi:hypothetical protein
MAEIIERFPEIVSSRPSDETILCPMKPFPALAQTSGNSRWLSSRHETAGNAGT